MSVTKSLHYVGERHSKPWNCLCVQFLQSVFWPGFTYPGNGRWILRWPPLAHVAMPVDPWWSM